jgi:riboflavin biosynthesis pyrimidine reductase
MPDSLGGPPLTLLGSDRQLDEGDLPQLYGYPEDHDGVWVRSNFITSLDGGATADGTSGTMAGPGDKLIFNQLRVLSDVILVGAGTVRIEGYSGAKISVAQRQQRQARNQTEVPPIAIVTKSGALDRDLGVFTKTEVPPLVLTAAAVADETRHRLAGLADIIDCSGRRGGGAGQAGGARSDAHPHRGRADAARLVHRPRPARRAVSDYRAFRCGRPGPAHRYGTGASADPDALRAHVDRRRRLSVHALHQSLSRTPE